MHVRRFGIPCPAVNEGRLGYVGYGVESHCRVPKNETVCVGEVNRKRPRLRSQVLRDRCIELRSEGFVNKFSCTVSKLDYVPAPSVTTTFRKVRIVSQVVVYEAAAPVA